MISESNIQPIVHLRFLAATVADAPVTGVVGAGVGLTQAKGLAAQVRALRRKGHDDDAISKHLKLAPGQIFKLLSTVKKAENAAAERLAHDGKTLPLGARQALKLNAAEQARDKGARAGSQLCDKGYAARIITILTNHQKAMSVAQLSQALGGGDGGVRVALRQLEAAGKVEKTGRMTGGRYGAPGQGAVMWGLKRE